MEEYIPGHTAAYLRSKCVRCRPYLGFHAYASCSGDRRDHRDLLPACSIPPGHQKPSNLILRGQHVRRCEREGRGGAPSSLPPAAKARKKGRGYPEPRQEGWPLSCPSRFSAGSPRAGRSRTAKVISGNEKN